MFPYCHFSPGQALSRAFSLTDDRNLAFTQASTHGFNTSKGVSSHLVGAVLEPAHGEETLAIQPFIDQRF